MVKLVLMRKRDWLYIILPLISVWTIDRITKIWASGLEGFHDFGIVGFALHHNHGAMLGLFSSLPPVLRIVSLSTGGAFLVFSYIIIQFLLPIKSIPLRSGMSMLLGGIIGNVTDRILYGYVVDFLVFKLGDNISPVMNLADVLQWFGYGLIVYALFKESKLLWPEQNLRKSYWINPKYQLKYCFILFAFGFAISLIAGVFSYTYIRVTLENMPNIDIAVQEKFLQPYILTFSILSLSFCIILFLVGLILSHRAAGPIYAFESFLEDLSEGKIRKLRLRAGDEFTHLEEVADDLTKKMQSFSKTHKDS